MITSANRDELAAAIRYPFREDSYLVFSDGAGNFVTLPDSLFLDLSVSAFAGTSAHCFLHGVRRIGSSVTLRLRLCGYDADVVAPLAGLSGVVQLNPVAGIYATVLLGNAGLAALATLAEATWFTRAGSGLSGIVEPSCVLYSPGAAVVSLEGDADGSVAITGSIRVVDGINTVARINAATGTVVIFAEPGAGYTNCETIVEAPDARALRRVNGLAPDSSGNVRLPVGGGLVLTPASDGLSLELSASVTLDTIQCPEVEPSAPPIEEP